ncbi:unnamed protein product [Bemisia tabaci]|uniref:Uncharacterized protein n=1 Tax=Bemisia tabaci TaxID=7038 RepID=A0A9P0AJA2_BEMTA|nr:unnamed protein product [Bemisia tabaci]
MDLLVRDRAEQTKFAHGEVVQVGQGEFDVEYETAGQLRTALRKRTLREWNARWQSSTKGPTTHSFFPSVHVRLKAKGTWERDTVAVLAGHGNFGQRLTRIGQSDGAREIRSEYYLSVIPERRLILEDPATSTYLSPTVNCVKLPTRYQCTEATPMHRDSCSVQAVRRQP